MFVEVDDICEKRAMAQEPGEEERFRRFRCDRAGRDEISKQALAKPRL